MYKGKAKESKFLDHKKEKERSEQQNNHQLTCTEQEQNKISEEMNQKEIERNKRERAVNEREITKEREMKETVTFEQESQQVSRASEVIQK
jgi:hypothetical protein